MASWQQALIFLINMLSSFYIICLMLRFLLQWVKADFYNPFCQMLIKITKSTLHPLRRVIPGLFGLDMAALVLMFVVQLVALVLVAKIVDFPITQFIVVVALYKLLVTLLHIYLFSIFAMALMSWFVHDPRHPLYVVLHQLNAPILNPIRRILPDMGGLDLSPMIAIIVLYVVLIFVRGWI